MGMQLRGGHERQLTLVDTIVIIALAVLVAIALVTAGRFDHHNKVIEKQGAAKVEIERKKADTEIKQGWEIVGRCGE